MHLTRNHLKLHSSIQEQPRINNQYQTTGTGTNLLEKTNFDSLLVSQGFF